MSNSDVALGSKKPLQSEFRFISAFEYDIAVEIFSYLTQQDCLTCMSVCRDWYDTIPSYTQNIWKEIQLKTRDALMDHQRRRRCLGSHVKHVVLQSIEDKDEERPLLTILRKLVSWQCTKIKHLELVNCTTPELKTFISVLSQLASHLTHLHLTHHNSSIPLLPVISVCRELTHLTYQYRNPCPKSSQRGGIPAHDDDAECRELIPLLSRMAVEEYRSKVTYIRIDAVMDKSVLKRCPELRCFIGVCCTTAWLSPGVPPSYSFADIDSIISWCPKINFLASNFSYSSFEELEDPYSYISDSPGLRYCNAATVDGIEKIAAHLVKNQDVLDFVSIPRWNPRNEDWSPIFEPLQMPNLRTLILCNVKLYTVSSFVTMLNGCSALHKLDLRCLGGLILDSTLVRSLCTINLVRSLWINQVEFRDKLSMMTFLERFPALETLGLIHVSIPLEYFGCLQCPRQLISLALSEITWISNDDRLLDTDEDVARFLEEQLTCDTSLESISLTYIPQLTSKGLLSIAAVSTLKRLEIQLNSSLQDEELLEFVKALGKSRIEQLTLYDCCQLSSDVFDALSELPLLEVFETDWCLDIDGGWTLMDSEALLRLLRKSQKLISIRFFCVIVQAEESRTLNFEQLAALIKSQSIQHDTTRSRAGHWEVLGSYNGMMIVPLTLEWLSS